MGADRPRSSGGSTRARLALGFGRFGVASEHRRKLALALLGLLVGANLLGIGLVLGSLLGGHNDLTLAQLLASAGAVLVVNVITFSLVFWEVDCDCPVGGALAATVPPPTSSDRRRTRREHRLVGWPSQIGGVWPI